MKTQVWKVLWHDREQGKKEFMVTIESVNNFMEWNCTYGDNTPQMQPGDYDILLSFLYECNATVGDKRDCDLFTFEILEHMWLGEEVKPKPVRYSHAFDINFEVVSEKEDGSDITHTMLRDVIRERISNMPNDDLLREAVHFFDTMEEGS